MQAWQVGLGLGKAKARRLYQSLAHWRGRSLRVLWGIWRSSVQETSQRLLRAEQHWHNRHRYLLQCSTASAVEQKGKTKQSCMSKEAVSRPTLPPQQMLLLALALDTCTDTVCMCWFECCHASYIATCLTLWQSLLCNVLCLLL